MLRLVLYPILFQLFIFNSVLFSQNPHPYFRNYTTEDGLPSSEVHHIVQDESGYIWIATDNGLSRFDGYEFRNYGPMQGLKHPVIFYLEKDAEGKVWLATMHGHLYYIQGDSMVADENNHTILAHTKNVKVITDFYIDSTDNKYIRIYSLGILVIDAQGNSSMLKPNFKSTKILATKIEDRWMVTRIYGSQKTENLAGNKADSQLKTFIEIKEDSTYMLSGLRSISGENWIKNMDGERALGHRVDAFFSFMGSRLEWEIPFGYNITSKAVFQDRNKNIYVGALDGGGIRKYSNLDAIPDDRYEHYLNGVSVSSIYQDNDGGIWIGTIENGIYYCPDLNLRIFDSSSGLPSDHVVALAADPKGDFFVGFRKGQLIHFNPDRNEYSKLPVPDKDKHNILFDLLYDDARDVLWMTNRRLNAFSNGSWSTYQLDLSQNYANPISRRMSISNDKSVLWGGHHSGFGLFNLDTKEHVYTEPVDDARTFRVLEDQHNRVWIGNINGIFEFKDGVLIPASKFFPELGTRTDDIAELGNGTLVMATKGEGVLIWDHHELVKINIDKGLSSNMVENVHVDKNNQIWAGTLEGLNKISKKGEDWNVQVFTIFNGLPSNEITRVYSRDSTIWIGTAKGLVKWRDRSISKNPESPIIEAIKVNGSYVRREDMSELSYGDNNLEIQFLKINFQMDGKVPYRFKLNNNDWIFTKNRSIYFANLSPGVYKFQVQAKNELGDWSASSFLDFSIKPAFWQTIWFFIFLLLNFIGLAWLYIRRRIMQIKAATKLESEINELQRSALRAQMNPHFIFNCLNSIQSLIHQNENQKAIKYLSKFAKLVRSTLNASTKTSISLEDEIELLESYLQLEKMRFKQLFDYTIEVDPSLDVFECMLPPLLTQPIIENAIVHGMQHRKDGGKIRIQFSTQNDQLAVEIRDNGKGYFHFKNASKNKNNHHQSMGTKISKDRLILASAANKFEIKELNDDYGNVIGTSVKMYIDQSTD